ncbi:MAG: hypothetical protein ACKPKO_61400 [Candidatus Fonsibacter sp.]
MDGNTPTTYRRTRVRTSFGMTAKQATTYDHNLGSCSMRIAKAYIQDLVVPRGAQVDKTSAVAEFALNKNPSTTYSKTNEDA